MSLKLRHLLLQYNQLRFQFQIGRICSWKISRRYFGDSKGRYSKKLGGPWKEHSNSSSNSIINNSNSNNSSSYSNNISVNINSFYYNSPNSYFKDTMDGFVEIKEGSASMLYDQKEKVFYNKVQVFNRDMSIQVCNMFSLMREQEMKKNGKPFEGITILDALAATGLRSIRYLKEIHNVNRLTINDILPEATTAAKANCERNEVDMSKVAINTGDATMLMYNCRDPLKQFDIIDLDPYGSAVPFLDSAVQAVSDGGLLCITCTDMTVLGGVYPEVCYSKYGCVSIKGGYVHELSLRILLHAIDSAANKYKRYIVPWMSLSVDFYVRVFVRVFESPNEVKKAFLKRGLVMQSTQCPSFYLQPFGSCAPGRHQNIGESTRKKHNNFNDVRNPKYKAQLEAKEALAKLNSDSNSNSNSSSNDNTILQLASSADGGEAGDGELEMEPSDKAENGGSLASATSATSAPLLNNKTFWKDGSVSSCIDISRDSSYDANWISGLTFTAPTMSVPMLCEETDAKMKMGGPFWMQQLHSQEIVDELLRRIMQYPHKKGSDVSSDISSSSSSSTGGGSIVDMVSPIPSTLTRIRAVLTAISEEIKDIPLYYILPSMISHMRISVNISILQMKAALNALGYRCSQFHREPMSIKTDAPNQVIWDIIRCQAELHPPKYDVKKAFSESALKMLSRDIVHRVDLDNLTVTKVPKVTKYPTNPEKEWGPKRKAGRQPVKTTIMMTSSAAAGGGSASETVDDDNDYVDDEGLGEELVGGGEEEGGVIEEGIDNKRSKNNE